MNLNHLSFFIVQEVNEKYLHLISIENFMNITLLRIVSKFKNNCSLVRSKFTYLAYSMLYIDQICCK